MTDPTGICKGGPLDGVKFRYTGPNLWLGYRGSNYEFTKTRCPETGLIVWIWRGTP